MLTGERGEAGARWGVKEVESDYFVAGLYYWGRQRTAEIDRASRRLERTCVWEVGRATQPEDGPEDGRVNVVLYKHDLLSDPGRPGEDLVERLLKRVRRVCGECLSADNHRED
jgi:hypothetical protein